MLRMRERAFRLFCYGLYVSGGCIGYSVGIGSKLPKMGEYAVLLLLIGIVVLSWALAFWDLNKTIDQEGE